MPSLPPQQLAEQAERMRQRRAATNDISIPPILDEARREKCGTDAKLWLKTYLPGWFPLDFSPDQEEIIESLEDRMKNGGFKCVAMDRGGGKTTIGKGMCLFGIFEGWIKFVFIAAATTPKAKKEFLSSILITLEVEGTPLAQDYPEVCTLFAQLQGKALRATSQTVDKQKTYIGITDGIIFPTVPEKYGSKCCGSIIKASGLTSSQRGAQHTTASGDIIRPDFIFFDDPQTDESARSEKQTEDREKTITAMVGMAGAGEKIGGYMACTVIEPDDLSERFLDGQIHPEWYGTKYQMVKEWPESRETLWNEYLELRREDMRAHDRKFTKCMDFYRTNREQMDKGAVIAWEGRKKKGDLSALQSAFNLVIEVGGWPTFMSEYQNEPIKADNDIYDLTPDIVCSRINQFPRYEVPADAKFLVAMCDINFVGINYAVVAFDNTFTGWIVDYGKYPERGKVLIEKQTPETEISRRVSAAVLAVDKILAEKVYMVNGSRVTINRILFDGNAWTKSVFSAVKAINKPQTVIIDRGTAASRYRWQKNLIIGQPFHKCHYEKNEQQKGKQIRHNADFWRMTAQKAFLLAPGVQGSLSLYKTKPQNHRRMADEVCAEKLVRFEPGDPVDLFHWTRKPGIPNDLLDCVVGCYVAAATLGATFPGMQPPVIQRKKRKRRRCNQTPT